jgi:predicted short-subunit dehydrogenase-like oxidoreductase (DUF2520 family)
MIFTKKDNLVIIGAGKIAYSLTPALQEAGYKIKWIISSKITRAEELSNRLNIKHFSDDLNNLKIKKGIFILAVPDKQIRITAERILRLKINLPQSLVIHLSGSSNVSILKSVSMKKAYTASFHIMQTFPSRRKQNIKDSFAAIETYSNDSYKYLLNLSKDLKLKPFRIDSRDKVIYHIAAVFASNFINAVLLNSQELFNLLGIREYSFNEIFGPLYVSTIKNIKSAGPAMALSGPVERGDLGTIKQHIREIKRLHYKKPELLSAYLLLSLSLIEAAVVKSGNLSEIQNEIKILLRNELKNLRYINHKND